MQKAGKARTAAPSTSELFRRIEIRRPEAAPIARLRTHAGIELELTAAAEPAWVAALLSALEARR